MREQNLTGKALKNVQAGRGRHAQTKTNTGAISSGEKAGGYRQNAAKGRGYDMAKEDPGSRAPDMTARDKRAKLC